MEQYINKDALVAEVYKWKNHVLDCGYHGQGEYEDGNKQGKLDACDKFVSIINTLEVKEVDLNVEEELKKYGISSPKTKDVCIASHFYELGLKARKGE